MQVITSKRSTRRGRENLRTVEGATPVTAPTTFPSTEPLTSILVFCVLPLILEIELILLICTPFLLLSVISPPSDVGLLIVAVDGIEAPCMPELGIDMPTVPLVGIDVKFSTFEVKVGAGTTFGAIIEPNEAAGSLKLPLPDSKSTEPNKSTEGVGRSFPTTSLEFADAEMSDSVRGCSGTEEGVPEKENSENEIKR